MNKENKRNNFIKSIYAGICIGIACLISMGVGGGVVGALLFSAGLMFICIQQYNLYTGRVGYITSLRYTPTYFICFIGNMIGTFAVTMCSRDTSDILLGKLANPLWLVFFKAVWCGFLMYLAVDSYKKTQSILPIIGGVSAFILCGFEHSVADAFYILSAQPCYWTVDTWVFLLVVMIGNGVGANIHKLAETDLH